MPRQIRADVTAARRSRSAQIRRAEDAARTRRATRLVDELLGTEGVVACYLSRDDEPDTWGLLSSLGSRARVLVPKMEREPDWAWFTGIDDLVSGPHQIMHPAGPALGPEALALAGLVIAPALAASPQGGRIGTGGGWYDRALPHRRPGVPVVVLLNDDEVRPCPQQPHDQPVDWIITPTRTIHAIR